MAAADRDVPMANYNYSSSPDLSSLPSGSPSEPGSPSQHDQNQSPFGAPSDEIVVGSSAAAPPFASVQDQNNTRTLLSDSVRLTKDGVPRKKPGRKPGPVAKKATDDASPSINTAASSEFNAETAKPRRVVRKPKDPNAPPVSRKRKAPDSTNAPAPPTVPVASGFQRATSAHRHFEPKVELTSMRMDIDSRSTPPTTNSPAMMSFPSLHPQPRQPPLTMMAMAPRREPLPNSMKSILNADDSPPRPTPAVPATSTTPVRSVGQSYDPIRSSTYDPVRENMLARDPYGTGPLGSPRAPSQVANRASASPSIASLVDPGPLPHTRSPGVSSSMMHQVSPPPIQTQLHMHSYHGNSGNSAGSSSGSNHNPFLPPSPSPANAARHPVPSSTASSARPHAAAGKTAAAAAHKTAASAKTAPSTPTSSVPSKTSSHTKLTASSGTKASASAKGGDSSAASKPHSRAAPSTAATAKSASSRSATSKPTMSKPATAKAAASKASAAKAAAAAAAAAGAAAGDLSSAAPSPTSSRDVTMTGIDSTPAPAALPLIKKFSSILHQERGKPNKTAASAMSSPKMSGTKDDSALTVLGTPAESPLPSGGEPERSILDFGKAQPGEQTNAPSIVLHIPLVRGENNKYVNFMRMAEERYGWDALHPRLAAHRDRKLRIAAAASALEKNGSGRESGEEMTDDMQSGDEGSNDEAGGAGDNGTAGVNASGPDDAPAKPIRKKRIMKEDEYDKDDDFVDDSEMLWEEQAAASRDGFFVYSGPLVPEEEKPAEGTPTTKKGRGTRTARTTKAATTKTAVSRTAGGAARSTAARKPRVTKQEKEQREREKAENEKALSKANGVSGNGANTSFLSGITIDV